MLIIVEYKCYISLNFTVHSYTDTMVFMYMWLIYSAHGPRFLSGLAYREMLHNDLTLIKHLIRCRYKISQCFINLWTCTLSNKKNIFLFLLFYSMVGCWFFLVHLVMIWGSLILFFLSIFFLPEIQDITRLPKDVW